MKGLVLLFLIVAGSIIGWGYTPKADKKLFKAWLGRNAWAVLIALVAVALAVLFSANITMRFL